eukprot:TRINITY_DN21562_c0_g1_i2.p1 TRINITY_DN21562_c0_g1~~TRINITY_DN21562_c0_g1_i2.p1  ORF type:complete len:155 (+),score=15.60 TRINITY_DN21562_c0_g1_i2:53-517(+)
MMISMALALVPMAYSEMSGGQVLIQSKSSAMSAQRLSGRHGGRKVRKFVTSAIPWKTDPHLAERSPLERRKMLAEAINDVAASLNKSLIRHNSHFPHKGTAKSISVPYEVKAGSRGIGLFLTEAVKKGEPVWTFCEEDHLAIYKPDAPMLTSLL